MNLGDEVGKLYQIVLESKKYSDRPDYQNMSFIFFCIDNIERFPSRFGSVTVKPYNIQVHQTNAALQG